MDEVMRIFGIIILLLSAIVASGQSAEERMAQLRDSVLIENADEQVSLQSESPRIHLGMNAGTGYSIAGGYGSGMNFYAAPVLSVPLANRLTLHAGIVASTFYPVSGHFQNEEGFPGMHSSLALFTAASYRMNERLTLHGSGIKQLVKAPLNSPFSSYPVDNLSLGATFRLGNNLTIGASVNINNRNSYYSPYFMPYGNSFGGFNPCAPFLW